MRAVAIALLVVLGLQAALGVERNATTGAEQETGAAAATGEFRETNRTSEAAESKKNLTAFNARPLSLGYAYNISSRSKDGSYFVLNQGVTKANTYKWLISLDLDKKTTATVKFVAIRPDESFDGEWKKIVTSTGDCLEEFDKVPEGQKFLFQVKLECGDNETASESVGGSEQNCTGLFGVFLKAQTDFEPFELVNNKQIAEFNLKRKEEWGPTVMFMLNNKGSVHIRARMTNANESFANSNNRSSVVLAFIAWTPVNESEAYQVDFNFTKDSVEDAHAIPDLNPEYEWYLAPQLVSGKNVSFIWIANQFAQPNALYLADQSAEQQQQQAVSEQSHESSVSTMAVTKPKPGKAKKVKPDDEEDEEEKESGAAAHAPALFTLAAAVAVALLL